MSNLTVKLGLGMVYDFAVTRGVGGAYPLNGCQVDLTATNGTQSLALSIGSGIMVPVPADGTGTVTIAPSDIATWTVDTAPLTWQLIVTDPDGIPFLVDGGTIAVLGADAGMGPSTCQITLSVLDGTGNPVENAFARVRVIPQRPTPEKNPTRDGASFISAQPALFYSDSSGLISFTIPQGMDFLVQCPAILLDHYTTAPALSTADLSSLSLRQRNGDFDSFDLSRYPVITNAIAAWGALR